MTFAEKLVAFMKGKKRRIVSTIGAKFGELYFTKEDAKGLLGVPENLAKAIYTRIKKEIETAYVEGLSLWLHPFCWISVRICEGVCVYEKGHMPCLKKDSDFNKLLDQFAMTGTTDSIVFSNAFYKGLIKEIENEKDVK